MTLSTCLKKAGRAIHAGDKAAVLSKAAEYRKGGMKANEAAIKAAGEVLAQVQAELTALTRIAPKAERDPDAVAPQEIAAETGIPAPDAAAAKWDESTPKNRRFYADKGGMALTSAKAFALTQKKWDALSEGEREAVIFGMVSDGTLKPHWDGDTDGKFAPGPPDRYVAGNAKPAAPAPVEPAVTPEPTTTAPAKSGETDVLAGIENDIPLDVAVRAFNGTSHVPEDRGAARRRGYVEALTDAWDKAKAAAGDDPEALARVTEQMERLRDGYRERMLAYLHSHANVASSMIAGPANFPVERNRKRGDAADKRAQEADEFLKRGIERLTKAAQAPVDKTPQGELAQLRARLAEREATQQRMKDVNAALRKGDGALRDLGMSDDEIAAAKTPDVMGSVGYPSYRLTNNNAEIHRLRERVAQAEARVSAAAAGPVERKYAGARIEENAQDDRLRLFFDGKPDEAVRTDLKANGFRWSPNAGAWQRQLTDNARAAAKRVLDKHFPGGEAEAQLKRDTPPPSGLQAAQVRQALAPALKKLTIPYQLHDSAQSASASTGYDIPYGARGMYFKGKLHVIADGLQTEVDAEEVFWHEVQHAGMDAIYGAGSKSYENALRGIAVQNPNVRAAAKVWMERFGQEDYEHRVRNGATPERAMLRTKLQAVDEALAELSGRTGENIKGLARFLAKVQEFMRAIGLHRLADKLESMTDAQALALIFKARQAVMGEQGRGEQGQMAPAFSKEQAALMRADGFDQAVDAAIKDAMDGKKLSPAHIAVGTPSPQLQEAGVADHPMRTTAAVIAKAHFDHGVTKAALKELPDLLDNPVAVFDSDTVKGSYVVVTSKFLRDRPLLVIVSPEQTQGGVEFNFVPTLYPKDRVQAIEGWIKNGLLRWVDQKQSPQWFGSAGLQLPSEYRPTKGSQEEIVAPNAEARNSATDEVEATPGTGQGSDSAMEAMLKKRAEKPAFSRASTAPEYLKAAHSRLNEAFAAPGKLSWWHKSFGTMYNLAERSPEFKPVFEAAQGFINDVSLYASQAADLAPRILPKLEHWRDITKSPISAEDNKAVEAPINQGTLEWTRDANGKPVRVSDVEKQAEGMTPADKAQAMIRARRLDPKVLRMWQGMQVDLYENIVNAKYEREMLRAGIVWTPAELKSQFNLTPSQIALYQEFRRAVDMSLDNMAKAEMLRHGGQDVAGLREAVMEEPDLETASGMLSDYLRGLGEQDAGRAEMLGKIAEGMAERAEKVLQLKREGYAPLSRFGQYTVDVVVGGERQYFGLYETAREANKAAMAMRQEFGAANVAQGTLSQQEFKLFAGITPESLEIFGNMLGLDSTGDEARDKAFQEYLQRTKSNRSAMKRLIHRKGIAGFSQDVGRVLASFVYSNARQTSAALHMGDLAQAITDIPKTQGELKDAAIGLSDYIKNPQEEAAAIRGLLFAQYLGGSIASAFVNMTQPFAVTFPWLSQYGGAAQSAAQLKRAFADLSNKSRVIEPDLVKAMDQYEAVLEPQEIHHLQAQARGAATLKPGDGTQMGDALAKGSNALSKLSLAWGKVFGMAEQINRKSTFIAAYRVAKAQKMADPGAFAKRAVDETQFVYSKANKMRFGRGAVGGTAMTFKTYTVAYLELLSRMYSQGGREGKQATLLALGVLFLMGGAGGLPFAENVEDLIDGALQRLGYNVSTKTAKREFLEGLFGRAGAEFVERGISGLPGVPIDVSGRLGMGRPVPGTGLFLKKDNYNRDLTELVGPAGDLARRIWGAKDQVLAGDFGKAVLQVSPVAVRNAAKGFDMAETGMYRDDRGYKVLDTTMLEAAMKSIGFQPATVAQVQESNMLHQREKAFYSQTAADIRSRWAKGIFEKDPEQIAEARAMLARWNENNPDQRMSANLGAIMKRVKEMSKSKDQRIADTAPKAMRANMQREAAALRGSLQ